MNTIVKKKKNKKNFNKNLVNHKFYNIFIIYYSL